MKYKVVYDCIIYILYYILSCLESARDRKRLYGGRLYYNAVSAGSVAWKWRIVGYLWIMFVLWLICHVRTVINLLAVGWSNAGAHNFRAPGHQDK